MSDFGERIRKIETQIIDLTVDDDLFSSPEFLEMFENPEDYLSEAAEALRSLEFTDQQKEIIALSMQRLDLPRFLSLAKYMLGLLESGSVSYDVFESAVFPPYNWNAKLAENYEQPDVVRFLHSVLESKQVDADKEKYIRGRIERILTGKAKSQVFDMRLIGMLYWSRWDQLRRMPNLTDTNKCNLFFYSRHSHWGRKAPTMKRWSKDKRKEIEYLPTPDQWADPSVEIPGWEVVTEPRRGDVVAIGQKFSDTAGHVGIVLEPGLTISAGPHEVVKNDWGFRPGQKPTFRRYVGP